MNLFNKKKIPKGLILILLILITSAAFWQEGLRILVDAAYQFGYIPEDLVIVGTGSMYPTWPKGTKGKSPKELAKEVVGTAGFFKYPNGIVVGGKRYFGYQIERGDIITAVNDKIKELTEMTFGTPSGVLKRVIAIGGDTLEIKEGIVYLNGQPLKEPYTAKAHSTFGEAYLQDCKEITVPQNSLFIMGDNRKGSADSREFGFVSLEDINYVLPILKQKGSLDGNWRDTSDDFNISSKIKLDKDKYLKLMNEKRKEAGVKLLKYQPKLEQSSIKRGQVILKYDDFSYEATKSGYVQLDAMNDAGYSNIVWNEGITQGYFDEEELMEYFSESSGWKKFILDKDMQEFGIAEVEGQINGCPTQVIVQHFAGYVPPNYSKDVVDSWKRLLEDLNSIIPDWEAVKGKDYINQEDLTKLLNNFYRQREIVKNIVSKMEANQWLTKQEEDSVEESTRLSKEASDLADKLNSR